MIKMYKTLLTLLLLMSNIMILHAQNGKTPYTMQEQLKLNVPSNPVMSPNGDKILFTIKKADFIKSEWNTQVYVFDCKTNSYKQFTKDGKSCTSPRFSPDQKWVTFLSDRTYLNKETGIFDSNVTQLWSAPTDGGEAQNWTWMKKNIDEYAWANDSKKIALLSLRYNEKEEKLKEKKIKSKKEVEVFPKILPDKVLSIYNVNAGTIEKSFILDPGAEDISFSNNGEKIIYQTNFTGEYDDEQKFDLFTIDMDGNKQHLTDYKGPETAPAYSKDDSHIAFISQTVPDIEFAETDLNIIASDGRSRINLTKNFNYSVASFAWKDNQTIYFTVKERTNQQLYKVDITNDKIEKLTHGNIVVSDISFSNNQSITYLEDDANSLPEIAVNGKRLSDFSRQLNQYRLGTQEVITYKSDDGKFKIDGLLFKPKNFNPQKKYPLILTIHGGPYGTFKNVFLQYYAVKYFNELGYLVFAPNPRGGSGYSDEFSQSARYDLGGGDYRDIMAGIDYLISKGFVDSTRMGVTGGSYGGYMTNWIISHTNRFKAAVSMYGLFSLFTDWSNSWQPSFEKMYLGYYYWNRPINMNNLYVSQSPAFYVQNIITPTLILHGAKDVYTDVANSREMYQALHAKGVPVEFVIYPRAGHGLKNEPNQYLDTVDRAVQWFNKFMK